MKGYVLRLYELTKGACKVSGVKIDGRAIDKFVVYLHGWLIYN